MGIARIRKSNVIVMPRLTLLLVCGLALAAGTLAQETPLEAWASRRPFLARLFGIGAGGGNILAATTSVGAGGDNLFANAANANANANANAANAADADNIPKVLSGYPGNAFSTLLAAVDSAGLGGALDNTGPLTLFAPNDDAFNKFLAEVGPLGVCLTPAPLSTSIPRVPDVNPSSYGGQGAGLRQVPPHTRG